MPDNTERKLRDEVSALKKRLEKLQKERLMMEYRFKGYIEGYQQAIFQVIEGFYDQ